MRAIPLLFLLASCATEPPMPTHAMPEIQATTNGPRQFKQFLGAPVTIDVRSVSLGADTAEFIQATKDFLADQLNAAKVQVGTEAEWRVEIEVTNFGHGAANFNGDNCINVVTRVIRPGQAFLASDMKTDRCSTNGQGMFAGAGDANAPAPFPVLAKRLDKLKTVRDEPALGKLYQTVMMDVLTKLDR